MNAPIAAIHTMQPIVGIVLAAGMSRRLGRPKQLLDLNGKSLVRHVVERCLASGLDEILVVVGHEAEAVETVLEGLEVTLVPNPDYREGQGTSLVAGVRAANGGDAAVIVLADQPGIDPQAIDRLITERRISRIAIGMAAYGDERGHPILFGSELFPELLAVTGDQGGREVIRRHQQSVVLVDGGAQRVPLDVDTEEAYAALLHSRAHLPNE